MDASDGVLNTFNRGEVGPLAFARDKVERIRNSAELVENWVPMRLGPMIRRGGFEVIETAITGSRFFEFFYSLEEIAALEMGDSVLRVWKDDALMTRTAVTSTLSNGDFATNLSGWTEASGSGSTVTQTSGGAKFVGADTTDAVLYQTLGSTQTGAEHGLRIKIKDAPLRVLIGTSGANSDDITDSLLQPGEYSLVFTPDAATTITFVNDQVYSATLESVELESAGVVTIPTPVPLANVDDVYMSQQAGQIYCNWSGEQFMIERRGPKSWGVVDYRVDDGPFDTVNLDEGLTLTASALKGDATLTASKRHFKSSDVGTLRRLLSTGQEVSSSVTAEDNGTDAIRVAGTFGTGRRFNIIISGSFTATVYVQRSTDGVGGWEDVNKGPYTSSVSTSFDDELDGAVFFYRLYVKPGDYTSGTVGLKLEYSGGGIEGVCRIKSVTSDTVASVQILTAMGSTEATKDWRRSQWGGDSGYPNANELYEGRLWQAGIEGIWASVSDAPRSYDRDIEGASRSIFKTVGQGPVEEVSWIAPASRLALGLASDVIPVRSSSFGEAMTQDNVHLRDGPNHGAAGVAPIRIGNRLYYVHASGIKLYELTYSPGDDGFQSVDQTLLHEDICKPGINELALAIQPETRLFVRLSDGQARIMLLDSTEDVLGWSRITLASGEIKRIFTLRGSSETQVYAKIAYGGAEYLCKLAQISDFNERPADLFTHYAGPIQTCTGLERFNGVEVEAWAGSVKIGTFTPSGGQIDLGASYSDVTVGLTITAKYKSAKLGQYGERSILSERKRIVNLALLMKDVWHGGLKFGSSETRTDVLPLIYKGAALDTTQLLNEYDTVGVPFEGDFDVDSRIYVEATGPATLLALSFDYDSADRSARAA